MLQVFLFFIKFPYTAGIIGVTWIGTACFLILAQDLSITPVVFVNMSNTLIMAYFGFRDRG